jgi:hypothetical protein
MSAEEIAYQHSVNEFISTIKPSTGPIKGIEDHGGAGLRIPREKATPERNPTSHRHHKAVVSARITPHSL